MQIVPCDMNRLSACRSRRWSGRRGVCGRLRTAAITFFAFSVVSFIGFCGDSFAKCGASTRQMIWKTGSSSDLLTWDGTTSARDNGSFAGASMDSTEHGERECTRCRCRKESERPLFPDLDLVKTSQQPVVSSKDLSGIEGTTALTDCVSVTNATFCGRGLGELERPPRS